MQKTNSITLDFRSYDENSRDTDINISINAEGVDDTKLMKVLNTWLMSIEANLKVVPLHPTA